MTAPDGPAWEFLLLFAVVIGGPLLLERARVPGIIGLLLGGYAIGPNGFGWISQASDTLPDLGQLGLLYLMFVAGLELDLALLRAYRRSAISFGLLTFAAPMAAGTAVGFALGWGAPAALLLGSLLASHTLIVYPLIRGGGLGSDPAVATAVGATVLTDTLALIVLAVVAGTAGSAASTWEVLLRLVAGFAVLGGFCFYTLPRAARWCFRRLGGERTVRYLVAIAGFLAAAVLAQVFGIEGIVGAFFAGLALNRLVPNEGRLMDRIDFFGAAVFIPVFLVSVGLILDPRVIAQPSTLGLAALFVVACVGGKALAAWLARVLLGFSGSRAGVMFALTTPQAAATLASTTIGYQIGLFGTSVVNAVLVLILVSLVVSPIAGRRFMRQVPRPSATDRPLGARVVLAVSTVEPPPEVFRLAARIAAPDGGVVHPVLLRRESDPAHDTAAVSALEAAASAHGVDGAGAVVVDRSLAAGIAHAAAAHLATLVVVDGPMWSDTAGVAPPAPVLEYRGTDGALLHAAPTPDLAAELGRRAATSIDA
ncbi:cation:proton antiporter [Phytohabitans sp. ZYX-F-186]|uniref:Cation:proton antiporter n=1 Tax=Phytohabitans maris TaxID=3071409 RepID=A0ABU0ZHR0_9ACTN|nr:cation:proton antiporter [Phytohabitans sp. ZYX-F-186]MDQ7906535.1 cation:proton antiporter [Phytohabitans sp. ZYX-F-186]